MTKLKPTPAAEPSVADCERLVATRAAELNAIQTDIAAAEASLYGLAESDDDDEKFEAKSLEIERLRRAQLRVDKRLITAEAALMRAKDREEQDRRRTLFEAGTRAAAEAKRLVHGYTEHATAIAGIFKAIDELRAPIEAANAALPEGEHRIDADHALEIYLWTELPAAVSGSDHIWWRGPRDASREPKYVPEIVSVQPTTPRPERQAGPQLLDNGGRMYVAPACEWPPQPEAEAVQ